MSYNREADASQRSHASKIIATAGGGGHSTPSGQNSSVKPKGYKSGGRVGYDDGGVVEGDAMEGGMPTRRLDRPSRGKKGGATTVNVIIAQKPSEPALPPMPPVGAAPPPPPPAGPMGPGGPPPGIMGRKSGGRVFPKLDAGGGSGPGRMEKAKAYGGKPAKTPKSD